ncbi:MAG: SIS domain-containing protein [Candidatus Limnocylindria bacterium]
MGLSDEIREQPEVTERLLEELPDELDALATAARRAGIDYVLIAARGSSDHAAMYGQYVLGAVARLPVALATPSLFSRYASPPRVARGLVIGVSQSGRSPDIVAVVEEARRQGAVTAAVTNDPASPLAIAAEHALALRAGAERSIAATKTYTAQLLVMAMLAAALDADSADRPRRRKALALVADAQRRALSVEQPAQELAQAYRSMEECVVLGRGFNLATAFEWALKLKELAYVRAQAYSTADFQHGPVASLAPGARVLGIAAGGDLGDDLVALLRTLREERGAHVLVMSGEQRVPGADHLPFPDELPEWLSPLVNAVPAQLFAAALAQAKGYDVERPRGLNKVTLTR